MTTQDTERQYTQEQAQAMFKFIQNARAVSKFSPVGLYSHEVEANRLFADITASDSAATESPVAAANGRYIVIKFSGGWYGVCEIESEKAVGLLKRSFADVVAEVNRLNTGAGELETGGEG